MSKTSNEDHVKHSGQLIGEFLSKNNVKFLFTLCGGHISPIFIGAEEFGLRVIDTRHEATAVFAADATYRLTGIPGVAAVTAGPGLTNSITPLKNAEMAQSAVILLGGATATMLKGRGSLQDIDQKSLIKPHVKWYKSIKRVKDIIPSFEKAFEISQSGVPGPVFLELPIDVLYPEELVRTWYIPKKEPVGLIPKLFDKYLRWHVDRMFTPNTTEIKEVRKPLIKTINSSSISKLSTYIENSTKPLILLGSQVALRHDLVTHLQSTIEKLGIPVYTSSMARGIFGRHHELSFRHNRRKALKDADLIILAGVPMDFRLDYGRSMNSKAVVVNINLDKSTLSLNRFLRKVNMKIHADPTTSIIKLGEFLPARKYQEWIKLLSDRENERNTEIDKMGDEETPNINPINLVLALESQIGENAYMVGDGGDFISTISYIVKPRKAIHWLDPGAFGTLGSGAGFALAAKLHDPESEVWLFYGDGSAGYTISEFDTFHRHNVNIIAVIGNDASWQQIAREQTEIFKTDVGTKLIHSNYESVVTAYQGVGIRVDNEDEVEKVLTDAINASKNNPVLINAILGSTEFRKGSISM